jgi:prefoldin subunit 5
MVDPGSQELTGIQEQISQIGREIDSLNQCRSEIADWTQCYSFMGRVAVLIPTQPTAFKERLMAALQTVQSGQDGESHVRV